MAFIQFTAMDDTLGLECYWSDDKHPQCAHGPTLLFGRHVNGNLERFYACSACRDRKLCRFYLKYGDELSKAQENVWEKERKMLYQLHHHKKLFLRFNELLATKSDNRCYCHHCERLIFIHEKEEHKDHEMTDGLTDYQMRHPTELLKPLDNAKKEAQYLFSKKSSEHIINMLSDLGAKQIICIGTPRIHEYITEHCSAKMSSLLLDLDGRFHNFFGPLSFCWYNLFNHHFFNDNAKSVFKDFLTQNKGKDTYLICDPPFGGRVEAMSQTIKKISDLYIKLNDIQDDEHLKIMFIFPYFMESIMREKSNPPSVSGGLKDLKMSDYRVDYENHPLFMTGPTGRKYGSPIRIFTNIPLNLLKFPESDGYKYCSKCEKWVAIENRHCKKCKECISKNGRTYKHCNLCKRCVKPTWKHCDVCQRCRLENHKCMTGPKVTGRCFKCNEFSHTKKECTVGKENATTKFANPKKRKIDNNNYSTVKKKKRSNDKVSIKPDTKSKKSKKAKPEAEQTHKEVNKKKLKPNKGLKRARKNGD